MYLASFFGRSVPPAVPRFSAARWQPRERKRLPKMAFLAPARADGTPITGMLPRAYLRDYAWALRSRAGEIARWLDGLSPERDLALLCWCCPERQRTHRGLLCHTIPIGWLVEAVRPDVPVAYLDGRDRPVWGAKQKKEFLRRVLPAIEAAREPWAVVEHEEYGPVLVRA